MNPIGEEILVKPAQSRVIVFTKAPGESFTSLSWNLAGWLRMFPPENCFEVNKRDLVAARNTAFRDLCLKAPSGIEHFIMVDRDMRPGPAALPFLQVEGDLVGCMYDTGQPGTWAKPDAVHGGLFRFNRKVVTALASQAPWWQFGYSPDGCDFQCECGSFQKKVQDAGLRCARGGWCGHRDKP